ncbi:alpha/beta hydrolase [Marinicella sp. W31]|uniref:alpha/beta hydrolase n=1 Tax=Marinicella sp. W31 TaxID=3023713 RepID=UPI003756FC30
MKIILTLMMGVSLGLSVKADESSMQFAGGSEAVMLSATLKVPENKIKVAAVLLPVTGPTDRDLTLGVHKYYKTLADGLADAGIASIRFDDRGVGESTGNYLQGGFEDRVADACAAHKALVQILQDHEFSIGYIGMSEGGGVAISAAHQCSRAAFAVMLSTPLRPGLLELREQIKRLIEKYPFNSEQKEAIRGSSLKFLSLVSADKPHNNRQEILQLLQGEYGDTILPAYYFVPKTAQEKADFVLSPWYQSQIHYDVGTALKDLKVPILSVYGSKDWVLNVDANVAHIKAQRPDVRVIQMGDLNHLMQQAKTGSPMEYAYLPENFSAVVIQHISDWLKGQF